MGISAIDGRNPIAFTQGGSFGPGEESTFGAGFKARSVLYGDRYAQLDRRQSYGDCTQHDSKGFDFDGRVWNPRSQTPLLSSEKASWYVPLKMRRPSSPYRLPKIIVDSFTNLLFGEHRFPQIRCEGDADTEDYARALAKEGKLSLRMIQARTWGGAMGTVGLSWCFYNGKPRFEVHNAKNLFVHSWEDRINLIPRHVTEVYPFYKVQWDGKTFAKVWYWFRRDWTPDWDIVFEDVLWEQGKDPFWTPDRKRSVKHNDGVCHLEWIQNLPSDDIDGFPDYEGLYDSFDAMDMLMSVVMRGATLNLDPTLKLKMDPELVSRMGVRKGSDNALVVGEGGDAEYMELGGSSIEAGTKLIEMKRRSILETAQCVVPDPHEVAAQGVSSVAIKAMFAPMTGKADVLREQYGTPIERVISNMLRVVRDNAKVTVPVVDIGTGQQVEAQQIVMLPPKIEREPKTDPVTGKTTGEFTIKKTDREPGESEDVTVRWPPYWLPTPTDQNAMATALTAATGGKAYLSSQTAVDVAASAFGVDPAEEWRRVSEQKQSDDAQEMAMTPGIGGQVPHKDALPPGAQPRKAPPFGGPPKGPPGAAGAPDGASDDESESEDAKPKKV